MATSRPFSGASPRSRARPQRRWGRSVISPDSSWRSRRFSRTEAARAIRLALARMAKSIVPSSIELA
jgi:hypothetical protein